MNYMSRAISNNNFFDEVFNSFFVPANSIERAVGMRTDIRENEKGYDLDIELPGFNKDQISVDLDEGYLIVKANKEESTEQKYLRKERVCSYSRSYYVGKDVTVEDVSAKYENGILSLFVPKDVQKKIESKKITIN